MKEDGKDGTTTRGEEEEGEEEGEGGRGSGRSVSGSIQLGDSIFMKL